LLIGRDDPQLTEHGLSVYYFLRIHVCLLSSYFLFFRPHPLWVTPCTTRIYLIIRPYASTYPCSLHVLTHLRISPYRHIRRSCRTGFFPLSTTSFMPTNQDPVLLMNVHARHALYLIMIYFPLMTFIIVYFVFSRLDDGCNSSSPTIYQLRKASSRFYSISHCQRLVLPAKSSGSYVTKII